MEPISILMTSETKVPPCPSATPATSIPGMGDSTMMRSSHGLFDWMEESDNTYRVVVVTDVHVR